MQFNTVIVSMYTGILLRFVMNRENKSALLCDIKTEHEEAQVRSVHTNRQC